MSWWNPFSWGDEPAVVPAASGKLYFLGLGFNAVEPASWGGWSGNLGAPENDVKLVGSWCRDAGAAEVRILTTMDVDLTRARQEILALATKALPGDRVVIWYSGHGGTGMAGDAAESGSEFLCLPRGPYPEWFLQEDLRSFRAGVRVFAGIDACHSEGLAKSNPHGLFLNPRPKSVPVSIAQWAAQTQAALFSAVRTAVRAAKESRDATRAAPGPDVALFAACREDEFAYDGDPYGAFTGAWNEARRKAKSASFGALFNAVAGRLTRQHPRAVDLTPGGAAARTLRAFA